MNVFYDKLSNFYDLDNENRDISGDQNSSVL